MFFVYLQDARGGNALILAASAHSPACVQALIKAGIKFRRSRTLHTPLTSLHYDRPGAAETLKALLEHKDAAAYVDERQGKSEQTPLTLAIHAKNIGQSLASDFVSSHLSFVLCMCLQSACVSS